MYSEECESNNFKNGLAIGIGLGLISGITSMVLYQRKKTLSADQVLEQVKESFLKEGSIEGSWISFEKEPTRKFAIHSKAYRGGISRLEDGEIICYELLADAYTGNVLEISRKKNELI